MGAVMYSGQNRAFNYEVAASIALHALLLFAFPGLKDAAKRPAPLGPIVARLVEPQPVSPPQSEPVKPQVREKPTPAPAKPQPAPRPVAKAESKVTAPPAPSAPPVPAAPPVEPA